MPRNRLAHDSQAEDALLGYMKGHIHGEYGQNEANGISIIPGTHEFTSIHKELGREPETTCFRTLMLPNTLSRW